MGPVIKRLWRWLLKHVRPLPDEPQLTKLKQADPQRAEVGFRFWF